MWLTSWLAQLLLTSQEIPCYFDFQFFESPPLFKILIATHYLRVFENGVLRRIFGPKKVEVRGGGWRKLYN
jgi:hypothetical protein